MEKAVFTYELATDIVFPNISVYRKFRDGVHCGYEVYSNEGYVMYDTAANDTEILDPEVGPVPTTYYYTWLSCPLNFNFANFTWVAVPRNTVPEDHIFGTDKPEHEVM